MDGIALAARFSLATNRLAFCGPADAEPELYRAITDVDAHRAARGHLARFEALTPYLEAIGARHGLDPFDERVVEAYWIGNHLLDAFEAADFRALLTALVRRGLPASIARRLEAHLPDRPLPHHAFHVAFVGVGSVTGHVATTLANIELCRPAAADVIRVEGDRLTVRHPTAVSRTGRLALGAEIEEEVTFDRAVLPGVRTGDRVVLHWRWPALVLDPVRDAALEEYTRRAWDAANQALPGLRALE